MKYFTKEPHGNFTEDCLGEAEGSAATADSGEFSEYFTQIFYAKQILCTKYFFAQNENENQIVSCATLYCHESLTICTAGKQEYQIGDFCQGTPVQNLARFGGYNH